MQTPHRLSNSQLYKCHRNRSQQLMCLNTWSWNACIFKWGGGESEKRDLAGFFYLSIMLWLSLQFWAVILHNWGGCRKRLYCFSVSGSKQQLHDHKASVGANLLKMQSYFFLLSISSGIETIWECTSEKLHDTQENLKFYWHSSSCQFSIASFPCCERLEKHHQLLILTCAFKHVSGMLSVTRVSLVKW